MAAAISGSRFSIASRWRPGRIRSPKAPPRRQVEAHEDLRHALVETEHLASVQAAPSTAPSSTSVQERPAELGPGGGVLPQADRSKTDEEERTTWTRSPHGPDEDEAEPCWSVTSRRHPQMAEAIRE